MIFITGSRKSQHISSELSMIERQTTRSVSGLIWCHKTSPASFYRPQSPNKCKRVERSITMNVWLSGKAVTISLCNKVGYIAFHIIPLYCLSFFTTSEQRSVASVGSVIKNRRPAMFLLNENKLLWFSSFFSWPMANWCWHERKRRGEGKE